MDKNAQLQVGSPCEYCGLPSVQMLNNVPVCPRHLQQARSAGPMPPRLTKQGKALPVEVPIEEFLKRARATQIDEVSKDLQR